MFESYCYIATYTCVYTLTYASRGDGLGSGIW